MHLHEYQAKSFLKKYGIPIPTFGVASNRLEAAEIVKTLDLDEAVIKIQVHAGGRGKAGGVKYVKKREAIIQNAEQLIGLKIVNQQTGPLGATASKVLISAPVSIHKEYYIAAAIDRAHARPILIASPEGGVEIEEIARLKPHKILKVPIDFDGKMPRYRLLELAKFLDWEEEIREEGMQLMKQLAQAFIDSDAELIEINPLVLTEEGHLSAIDAKMTIDDNALYRQPDLAKYYDPSQLSPNEREAKEYDLAYIGLQGNIGCLVNGAGLAMATMDIIQYYGGSPSNFLDVGGSATQEQIAAGFRIIQNDPNVAAIFVNIFGGIMDCAILAHGIVEASKNQLTIPLIVRMEGTNIEEGLKILKNSGLSIVSADSMEEGAKKAIDLARDKRN